ncbi:YfiH family protein [Megasphaera vaginalis (ex Srinivasan et al. 2021)]|uniref:Purine nucleoside phosphorylase n=2 Tax=Megasphaera vaginalis (ex Srinivasan et al. 2021) TaxID=1111454 RepID=U7UJH2_9FIRM|nr:YfiH family protein [Megasphaera vaginalis (ex Srinivasan et al. 2021)]
MFAERRMSIEWIERDGLAWERSGLLAAAGLCHGVMSRKGGVSKAPYDSLNLSFDVGDSPLAVLENRRRFCRCTGCDLRRLTTVRQAHGDHVVSVGRSEIGNGAGGYAAGLVHADALITALRDVPLLVTAADCLPVILYDPIRRVTAAIHIGWQGTVGKLALKTLLAMELAYGSSPQDMLAYIGPFAGAAHFAVSRTIAAAVAALGTAYGQTVVKEGGQYFLDLQRANYLLLLEGGVRAACIEVSASSTYEAAERFYSYRRDCGRTGRFGIFSVLKSAKQDFF